MNPWDVLAWVGAIGLSVVIVVVVVSVVVSLVRSIRNPKPTGSGTRLFKGDRS